MDPQLPHPDAIHDLGKPHPLVGRIAIAAIVAAVTAIIWAKVEFLGTHDIERTLGGEVAALDQGCEQRLQAVASSRWATGFSQ